MPFPFVDFKKLWDVVSNPKLFKGPEVSAKEGRAMVAEYKRQYAEKNRVELAATARGSNGKVTALGYWATWFTLPLEIFKRELLLVML